MGEKIPSSERIKLNLLIKSFDETIRSGCEARLISSSGIAPLASPDSSSVADSSSQCGDYTCERSRLKFDKILVLKIE
jgi:hypothetical protein